MAKAVVTFASDDASVIKAIEKMQSHLSRLEQQNKKLAESSAASSKSATSGIDATIAGLGRMVAGYASVGGAIALINSELREKKRLEDAAATARLAASATERDYLRNLGITTPENRTAALSSLRGISAQTGVPLKDLYGAGASALSASGGDFEIANAAVGKAARIAPEDPQAIAQFAGAIIDLGKAFKTFDANKGLDLLIGMQSTSRVSDMGKLAANAPRGVIGARVAGFTPEEGAALFDTFSNAMADKEGAVSATATSNLAARMRAFGEKHGMKDATGMERFNKIANDPAMRKQFLDKLEQSESKPFTELMLTPGTAQNEMFRSLSKSKMQQGGQAEKFITDLNETGLQQSAGFNRNLDQRINAAQLANKAGGDASIIRRAVDEALAQGGDSGYGRYIKSWPMSFSSDPLATGQKQLAQQLVDIRPRGNQPMTEETARQIKVLEETLAELKKQSAAMDAIKQNQHRSDPKANR